MTIRVGIIGYGYAAKTFHVPMLSSIPAFRIVRITTSGKSRDPLVHPLIPTVTDAHLIVEASDIDLVVIATPNDSHAHWAIAALKAGKHVVVEKPFALDVAEARSVMQCAIENGRLLSVFHNRRWDSDYLTVRAAIESGAIGRVAHFESHFDRFRPAVQDRWRERAGPGSGIWFDLAPHLVDQALQLFGPPRAIEANFATLREGAQAPDWAHAILHYDARRIVLHASMLVAGGSPRFVVHGDRGSLVKMQSDRQEDQLRAGLLPGASGWGEDADDLILWRADGDKERSKALPGDQRIFYRRLAEAILSGGPNPVPPSEAIAVMTIIEAGVVASREGRVQPIELS